jgi:hypothetical protein
LLLLLLLWLLMLMLLLLLMIRLVRLRRLVLQEERRRKALHAGTALRVARCVGAGGWWLVAGAGGWCCADAAAVLRVLLYGVLCGCCHRYRAVVAVALDA